MLAEDSGLGGLGAWGYLLTAGIGGISTLILLIPKVWPTFMRARAERETQKLQAEKQSADLSAARVDQEEKLTVDAKRQAHREWADLFARQEYAVKREQDRADRAEARADALYREIRRIQAEEADILVKNERLQAVVSVLKAQVERHEVEAGAGDIPTRISAIVTAGADGVITSANQPVVALLHWRTVDLVGKPVTMLVPEDKRADFAAAWERTVKAEKPVRHGPFRVDANLKDGGTRPITVTLATWEDQGRLQIGAELVARPVLPDGSDATEVDTSALAAHVAEPSQLIQDLTRPAALGGSPGTTPAAAPCEPGGNEDSHGANQP